MDEVKADLGELLALSRDLKKLGDGDLRKTLRSTDRAVAQRIVTKARNLADQQGKQMSRAGKTIKPLSSAGGAAVQMGTTDAADSWANAAMFGTYQNKQRPTRRGLRVGYRQFKPVREGGYTVYPVIKAERDDITEMYAEAIEKAVNSGLK